MIIYQRACEALTAALPQESNIITWQLTPATMPIFCLWLIGMFHSQKSMIKPRTKLAPTKKNTRGKEVVSEPLNLQEGREKAQFTYPIIKPHTKSRVDPPCCQIQAFRGGIISMKYAERVGHLKEATGAIDRASKLCMCHLRPPIAYPRSQASPQRRSETDRPLRPSHGLYSRLHNTPHRPACMGCRYHVDIFER